MKRVFILILLIGLLSPLTTLYVGLNNIYTPVIAGSTNTTIYLPITVYSYDTVSGSYTFKIVIDSSAPPEFWRYVSYDGSDIYVLKNGTLVYYWIESFNLIDRKLVLWIHDDDYHNGTTYEIHFGEGTNPYSNYNDQDKIFLLYDDFTGSSLNTDKWTILQNDGSITVSDGIVKFYRPAGGKKILLESKGFPGRESIVIEYKQYIVQTNNYYYHTVAIGDVNDDPSNPTENWSSAGYVIYNYYESAIYTGPSIRPPRTGTSSSTDGDIISNPTGGRWQVIHFVVSKNDYLKHRYDDNEYQISTRYKGVYYPTEKLVLAFYSAGSYSEETWLDYIKVYTPFNISYSYGSVALSGLPPASISNRQYLEFYLVPGAVNEIWYDPRSDNFSIHYYPAPGVSIAFGPGSQNLQPTTRYSKYYIYGYTTNWDYNFYVYDQDDVDLYHEHAAGYFEMSSGNEIRIYGYDTTYDNGWVAEQSYTSSSPATLEYSPNYDGNNHGKLAVESSNGLASVYTTTSTNWNYGLEYAKDLDYWSISTSSSTDGDLGINQAEVIYLRFKTPGVVYHNITIKYIGDPNTYVLDPSVDIIKINAEWKPGRVHPTIFVEYTYNVSESRQSKNNNNVNNNYVENTFGGDLVPLLIVLVIGLMLSFFLGEKGMYLVIPVIVYYSRNGVISMWIGIVVMLGLFLFVVYRSGLLRGGGEG